MDFNIFIPFLFILKFSVRDMHSLYDQKDHMLLYLKNVAKETGSGTHLHQGTLSPKIQQDVDGPELLSPLPLPS